MPGFNATMSGLLGPNALDPTDLWALPALIPSWAWMRRRPTRGLSPRLHVAAVIVSGLASIATSHLPGKYVRNYPGWAIDGPRKHDLGCASAEAWVLKSGKQGAGVVVELKGNGRNCPVQLQSAEFALPHNTVPMTTRPVPVGATGAPADVYVSFLFDGDSAWNGGDREAALHLVMLVNGDKRTWDLHLTNRLDGGPYVFQRDERGRR